MWPTDPEGESYSTGEDDDPATPFQSVATDDVVSAETKEVKATVEAVRRR